MFEDIDIKNERSAQTSLDISLGDSTDQRKLIRHTLIHTKGGTPKTTNRPGNPEKCLDYPPRTMQFTTTTSRERPALLRTHWKSLSDLATQRSLRAVQYMANSGDRLKESERERARRLSSSWRVNSDFTSLPCRLKGERELSPIPSSSLKFRPPKRARALAGWKDASKRLPPPPLSLSLRGILLAAARECALKVREIAFFTERACSAMQLPIDACTRVIELHVYI